MLRGHNFPQVYAPQYKIEHQTGPINEDSASKTEPGRIEKKLLFPFVL